MRSITFWRKRTEKGSSDSAFLSFDLLSNLTYMAALAASAATRDKIFERSIAQPFKTTIYFKQVYLLVKRLGFQYAHAFQVVSKKATAETVRSLLLRFASSMSSGASELSFLTQEAAVERETYTSGYLRKLDSLQKWFDVYAALMVSVTTIILVNMITSMLFPFSDMFIVVLCVTAVLIAAVGAFVIYKATPYEVKMYKGRHGPWERRWAIRLFWLMLPLSVAIGVFLLPRVGMGVVLLVVGVALIPSGLLAFLDDLKVNTLDKDISSFIRALGTVTASLHSTIGVALNGLDRRSVGKLEPYVRRLQTRLDYHLDPDLCWEKFRDETGSELINRTTRMFVDGAKLGGEPDKVSEMASDYARNIALLRDRRHMTASNFAYVIIPLHGTMVSLLIFVLEIMKLFNSQLTGMITSLQAEAAPSNIFAAIPTLPFFQMKDLTFISYMFQGVIIGLTLVNSIAPRLATGGHLVKSAFYASIMCILSGLSLLVIPLIAQKLLTT